MLVLICVVRKCIEWTFTSSELRALDDLLPGREKEKRKVGRMRRPTPWPR